MPYAGDRSVDYTGAFLSVIGMGGLVLGVLAWQEGGESVALLLAIGAAAMAGLVYWLVGRKRQGKPTLLDPTLFASHLFKNWVAQILLQQVALGGLLIALPIYLQLVWGYNRARGGHHARTALAHDVRRRTARGTESGTSQGEQHHPGGASCCS